MTKTRCAILICMVLVLLTTQTAWAVNTEYMPKSPQHEKQVKHVKKFKQFKKVCRKGHCRFVRRCKRRWVRVRWRDNLTKIARRFHASKRCIARANHIRSWRVRNARRPGVLFRARRWLVIPCYCRH